jgi:hypothetical protein
VPLVDRDGRPVGILSVKDIVHYIVALLPERGADAAPDPQRSDAASRATVRRGRVRAVLRQISSKNSEALGTLTRERLFLAISTIG